MFTVVFANGHRVSFEYANSLLIYVVINCPKLSLFYFKRLTDWIFCADDFNPFVVYDYNFYIVKEK